MCARPRGKGTKCSESAPQVVLIRAAPRFNTERTRFLNRVSPSGVGELLPPYVLTRDTRREQNQKLFRMGNKRLDEMVDGRLPEDAKVPFLCECADESCRARVELERSRWASVVAKPNHYVMVPGHPHSEGEVVVGDIDEYDVVRKPASPDGIVGDRSKSGSRGA